MMKRMVGLLPILLILGAAGQVEPAFETRVTLKVRNDEGVPVVGADAHLGFLHARRKSDVVLRGVTDAQGRFGGAGKVVDSLRFSVKKVGYYPIEKKRALIRMEVDEREVEEAAFPLVMRERINPSEHYAKRVSTAFPSFGEWVGFDFERGKWQEGNDGACDVLLRFSRKLREVRKPRGSREDFMERLKRIHQPRGGREGHYTHLIEFYENERFYSEDELIEHSLGLWRGRLEIKFPGEKEGIVVVDRDYIPYCALRMPHLAYEEGYVATRVWQKENGVPAKDKGERGYFLRTRVELDEAGEIVSAHYAKIIEEIKIDPRGRIEFAYVFNPAANDRNLEFSPEKNLFGKLPMDEEVRTP